MFCQFLYSTQQVEATLSHAENRKTTPAKSLKLGNVQGVRRSGSQKKGYVDRGPKDFLAIEDMA